MTTRVTIEVSDRAGYKIKVLDPARSGSDIVIGPGQRQTIDIASGTAITLQEGAAVAPAIEQDNLGAHKLQGDADKPQPRLAPDTGRSLD